MTFTFTLTKEAHIRAMQDMAKRTLAYKVSWAVLGGLAVLSILVAASSGQGFARALTSSSPYLVVFLGILVFGFPLAHMCTARHMYRHNRVSPSPHTCDIPRESL